MLKENRPASLELDCLSWKLQQRRSACACAFPRFPSLPKNDAVLCYFSKLWHDNGHAPQKEKRVLLPVCFSSRRPKAHFWLLRALWQVRMFLRRWLWGALAGVKLWKPKTILSSWEIFKELAKEQEEEEDSRLPVNSCFQWYTLLKKWEVKCVLFICFYLQLKWYTITFIRLLPQPASSPCVPFPVRWYSNSQAQSLASSLTVSPKGHMCTHTPLLYPIRQSCVAFLPTPPSYCLLPHSPLSPL